VEIPEHRNSHRLKSLKGTPFRPYVIH
jgi:hypothetical protein